MNKRTISTASIHEDFPLDDLTYDLVTVLYEKSKTLETYNRYILDAKGRGNQQIAELFEQIKQSDHDSITKLKEQLGLLLKEEKQSTVA